MKTQASVSQIALRLFLSLIISNFAHAHSSIHSWQNRSGTSAGFNLKPEFTFYKTSANYGLLSTSVPLANNVSVQRYYFDLNATYGITENFFIFARLSAMQTKIANSTIENPSIFGLSDQMIGTAYRLFQSDSGFSINLQGEVSIPAYQNNSAVINHTPFLGDGTTDFTGGAFVEVPLTVDGTHQYTLDAGAGYTYRSYGYSSAIPWNFLLKRFPIQDGLVLSAGLRGTTSLETDLTSATIAAIDQNKGAGGSFLINGINSSWTLAQAAVGYQTKDNTTYALSGAIPLSAKNSPDGVQISLSAQFELGASDSVAPTSSKRKKPKTVHEGTFKTYDLEAKVTSVNDQLYILKIDQGAEKGIEKGQVFDIFSENTIIARAKVTHVKSDQSALRVLEYFVEQSIEVDAVAKREVERNRHE